MAHISELNLRKLDFQVLELFAAVMRFRSVSQAALTLDMQQPTASRSLNRMREALADELFVRTTHGMQPTRKAFEIADTVQELLTLGRALGTCGQDFDPHEANRVFVLAASDVGQALIVPLLEYITRDSPGITLRIVGVPGGELGQALEDGAIDMAFGPYPALLGGIRQRKLYDEHYRCFCRSDHPLVRKPTLETFLNSGHLLVAGRIFTHAHREVEALLRDLLPRERIRISGESYLMALLALSQGDLVLTAPARVTAPIASQLSLISVEPPLELPRPEVKLYWHERNHEDAGHRWLRDALVTALISHIGGSQPGDAKSACTV